MVDAALSRPGRSTSRSSRSTSPRSTARSPRPSPTSSRGHRPPARRVFVHKAEDGEVTLAEITDIDGDGIPDLVALQGDIPGLFGEDDATSVIAEMPNDSAILMLAWENTWAIRTAAAIRANGGTLVAMERIAADDVQAVLAADEHHLQRRNADMRRVRTTRARRDHGPHGRHRRHRDRGERHRCSAGRRTSSRRSSRLRRTSSSRPRPLSRRRSTRRSRRRSRRRPRSRRPWRPRPPHTGGSGRRGRRRRRAAEARRRSRTPASSSDEEFAAAKAKLLA